MIHLSNIINRRKLFFLFLLGGGISALAFSLFFAQLGQEVLVVKPTFMHLVALTMAVLLHAIAHYLRAQKSAILFQPIRPVSPRLLFETLSISYLYNAILPFRLGELIRAYLVGRQLAISRSVVFFMIIFEHIVDGVLLLGVAFVLIAIARYQMVALPMLFYTSVGVLFAATTLAGLAILLLYLQHPVLLRFVYRATQLLNDTAKNKVRFVIWSIIYGIHTMLKQANLRRYIFLSGVMWVYYLFSVGFMILFFYPTLDVFRGAIISLTSFLSVMMPAGPAFIGTYHYYFSEVVASLVDGKSVVLSLAVFSWALLIIPISLLGTGFVILHRRGIGRELLGETAEAEGMHKLLRHQDISQSLSYFLHTYFSGMPLIHVLNKQEIAGTIRVLKTFKGGSNAVTALIWNGSQTCVRKVTLPEYASKLDSQYRWLNSRSTLAHIPKVLDIKRDSQFYALDIELCDGYIPYFEYIHSRELEKSKRLLQQVVYFMHKSIYQELRPVTCPNQLDKYIQTKIYGKVQECLAIFPHLSFLVTQPTLVVNGVVYDNFEIILNKIMSDQSIMTDLATYRETSLHGDLTVDNLLARDDDFMLIDPNDENHIADPIVDYAKLYQSFHSGYEFLCIIKETTVVDNTVQFEESISSKYTALFAHLQTLLGEILLQRDYKLIMFHEAVHYFRMLPYRARINADTFPAFYAVAVRLLNEFYLQYGQDRNNATINHTSKVLR